MTEIAPGSKVTLRFSDGATVEYKVIDYVPPEHFVQTIKNLDNLDPIHTEGSQ
jgi:hypothetical protein